MQNVVLAVHLILALLLVGVVLLQRSEGGGLGMGSGGGGGGGVMSGRGAATAMTKVTWILAAGFIATSITLTIMAAGTASTKSVIDQIGGTQPAVPAPATPTTESPLGSDLLPPAASDAPATPPAAPAPATDSTAPATPVAPATTAPATPAPASN